MRRFIFLGFLLLLAFDTAAQIGFKYAGMGALPLEFDLHWLQRLATRPWIYAALGASIGAFFTWLTLLRHAPIGPAFAATHLQVVSVLLVSAWLFNESLTATHLVGAALIVAGILCLAAAPPRSTKAPSTR